MLRDIVLEQQRSIGRAQYPGIRRILHGDWQTMQGAHRRTRRIACVGLTLRTIRIDGNESRQLGVVCGDTREMSLERLTCGNLTPRQSLGKSGGRKFAGIRFNRHRAGMHELPANDESTGTGFAFPLMSGGVLHG
jgi:hypothetical protein